EVGLNGSGTDGGGDAVPPAPLDVRGGETQGAIGYLIQQACAEEFRRRGIGKAVVAIVTRVVVDGHDPALDHPTKFVGLGYPQAEAERLARERGWSVAEDGGTWRR